MKKYKIKKQWLLNVPLVGVIYIAVLGFKYGWDSEIEEDENKDNSIYLGISSAIVLWFLLILMLNLSA